MIYGVPFIELNSKAMVPLRGYGRDKTRLSFVYKVSAGETDSCRLHRRRHRRSNGRTVGAGESTPAAVDFATAVFKLLNEYMMNTFVALRWAPGRRRGPASG